MKTRIEFMVVVKGQKMFYTTEQAAKLAATLAKTKYFKVKTLLA